MVVQRGYTRARDLGEFLDTEGLRIVVLDPGDRLRRPLALIA